MKLETFSPHKKSPHSFVVHRTKECNHESCTRCKERHTQKDKDSDHVCCTRIQHLSVKMHNQYILEDVNIHVHCGELTAIIGKNGAGKTTLLKTLLHEIPHTGEIHFMKNNSFCTSKPLFGYVPQQLTVDQNSPVSVSDLILAGISSRPVWLPPRKKDKEEVRRILSVTHAEALATRRLCELSGGEMQRVMLALAINPIPDILLLDEPVSGIDKNGLALFYNLVSQLRHSYDITILLISHDLDLVAKYADKVILIDKTILAEGTPQQVYATPAFARVFGTGAYTI